MTINPVKRVIFILTIFLCACGPTKTTQQEMTTIRMTMSDQISYAPLLIAEAEGYFAENGIQIEQVIFNKSSEAVALLLSGDTDVYAGTLNAGLLNTIYESGDIKAVADRGHVAPDGCTYQAIMIRRDLAESGSVTQPEDLSGHIFSASTAGPAAFLLSSYLAEGGLTFDDIQITDLPATAEIDAFTNNTISGSVAPEPTLTGLLDSGTAVILARAEDVLGTFQSGLIAFNQHLLEGDPDLGVRFLAAYLKGIQQYNEGKTERNLQILTEATGETIETLQAACWVAFRDDGTIDFSGVDPFQQWSIAQGHLDNAVTEEQFMDMSPVIAAQEILKP